MLIMRPIHSLQDVEEDIAQGWAMGGNVMHLENQRDDLNHRLQDFQDRVLRQQCPIAMGSGY